MLKGVKWSANLWVWNGPRDGTFHYPRLSKDVSLRNDHAGRAKVFKEDEFLGTLDPGEEAPFFMHFGQTWKVVSEDDPSMILAEWTIDGPEPGTYVHYKNGKHYTVIDVVTHSETEEIMVLYRAEYGDYGLWVRPLVMFMEMVHNNGEQVRRFEPVQ